ncbi:MAG: thioredoxin family protein [Armatimonadota bacterium]|nr:thioredoxin family protein [Armatimonadota bacterium]MDR7452776.1 thioredoxin family protein [Armatimonadota bacterium]MDR7468331.1 thioredoxin family protein [Armatimonadota bacterium]MDR7495276.1 thioredoxin family protein [Armatimonadota bacterium]MDR7500518.1 thioredoxin family protein [Armatimonadota bacterium]
MADRLLVLMLVAAGAAIVWLILRWRSARYRRTGAADLVPPGRARPLVLAFSTPDCVPCRTQQKPALHELLRRYPGRVEVRAVDAADQPDLADRFGIMTVPSTVVIDPRGRIVAINHGMTRWEKLAAQLNLNGARAPVRIQSQETS